jgi:cytochrome c-type biogenesis protein
MEILGKFPVIASFLAGILTFISPCILPLIPAYISFITGESVEELQHSGGSYRRVLGKALLFVLGFSLVFVLLGASASFVGGFLGEQREIIRWAGGILVILFGLHTAGIVTIPLLYHQKQMQAKPSKLGFIEPLVIGLAFAIGWTPCVGPILSSLLILASTQETVYQGMMLLTVYSLGLGVPFILTALFITWALKVFSALKRYYRAIEIVSGSILVLVGILLLTDSFKVITTFFLKIAG